MVDPTIAIGNAVAKSVDATGAEAARVAGNLFTRLLGPSADVLGEHWGAALANRLSNVHKVTEMADRRISADAPGAIPPRVASSVFEAAQYADDEFVAEYLSGVLASSRTPGGTDDRGVPWTALVARLSSDQLRMHYVLYSLFRRLVVNESIETMSEWNSKQIVVYYRELLPALGLELAEESVLRMLDAVYALQREGLIGDELSHGSAEFLSRVTKGSYKFHDDEDALIFQTSAHGVGLFLQAHGYGGEWITAIADPAHVFELVEQHEIAANPLSGDWLT